MYSSSAVQPVDPHMVQLHRRRCSNVDVDALVAEYSLKDASEFVQRCGYRRVGLQFPDDLLGDTVNVVEALQRILRQPLNCHGSRMEAATQDSVTLFVLSDTTFSPCCVDEITAQHCGCDAIIHFGFACLGETSRLPVLNVLPKFHFDLERAIREVVEFHNVAIEVVAKIHGEHLDECCCFEIVVFAAPGCDASELQLFRTDDRISVHDQIYFAEVHVTGQVVTTNDATGHSKPSEEWRIAGVRFPVRDRSVIQFVYFLGPLNSTILEQLALVAAYNGSRHSIDPTKMLITYGGTVESSARSPPSVAPVSQSRQGTTECVSAAVDLVGARIRQRMFNLEQLKRAESVGIVVTSLTIVGYLQLVEELKRVLHRAGRRVYTIFIGNLNTFKIANFVDSVDCFVIVACPNNRSAQFASRKDGFHRPLVSPAEVFIAFGSAVNSSPDEEEVDDTIAAAFMSPYAYTTDFTAVLRSSLLDHESGAVEERDGRSATTPAESGSAALTVRSSAGAVAASSAAGALARFAQRTYQGLELRAGMDPIQHELVDGKSGIAKGYSHEPSN